tara:strand:- start:193 stop:555 length:363 start_codon:yes stop_codon:yes gene_type:complete
MSLEIQVQNLIDLAEENKVSSVSAHDVTSWSSVTDSILVMSVTNITHCNSLSERIIQWFKDLPNEKEEFFCPPKVSGDAQSGWVILDANSIIVHILLEELTDYYQLDTLFSRNGGSKDPN